MEPRPARSAEGSDLLADDVPDHDLDLFVPGVEERVVERDPARGVVAADTGSVATNHAANIKPPANT